MCAFTTLKGIFAVQNPKKTALAILVDKEEIGSTGNTGMLSAFFEMTLAEVIEKINGNCTITDYNSTIENSAISPTTGVKLSFLNFPLAVAI